MSTKTYIEQACDLLKIEARRYRELQLGHQKSVDNCAANAFHYEKAAEIVESVVEEQVDM